MKKVLVLLLVLGILVGTIAVVEDVCENTSFQGLDFSDKDVGDNDNPSPCGGHGGGDGGVPG